MALSNSPSSAPDNSPIEKITKETQKGLGGLLEEVNKGVEGLFKDNEFWSQLYNFFEQLLEKFGLSDKKQKSKKATIEEEETESPGENQVQSPPREEETNEVSSSKAKVIIDRFNSLKEAPGQHLCAYGVTGMIGKELGLFAGAKNEAQRKAIVDKYKWAPTLAKDLRAKGKSITDPAAIEASTRSNSGVRIIVLNDTYAGTEDHVMVQVGTTFYEMRGGRRQKLNPNDVAFERTKGNISMAEATSQQHIKEASDVRDKNGDPDWAKQQIASGLFQPYVKEVIDISHYFA